LNHRLGSYETAEALGLIASEIDTDAADLRDVLWGDEDVTPAGAAEVWKLARKIDAMKAGDRDLRQRIEEAVRQIIEEDAESEAAVLRAKIADALDRIFSGTAAADL
jgi:hypothetical protein